MFGNMTQFARIGLTLNPGCEFIVPLYKNLQVSIWNLPGWIMKIYERILHNNQHSVGQMIEVQDELLYDLV